MANNHQREQEIFGEALELESAEERLAFVKDACGADPELRRGVEALLEAYSAGKDFIPTRLPEAPDANPAICGSVQGELQSEPPNNAVGTTIGRYKLLEIIGQGGCGVVYVAEQTQPVRRRVALKVIKLGMDTRSVVARFEAERQALAMMDHPNIAKVHDGGATETGRPYFVMELVRGIKITEYCDQNNLSTRERLDLFTKVCQAVQHAHQKGIIHRDLKPSNILVTINDGPAVAGVPKVIDFGIAKATAGQELTDKTIFTAFEQFIGTPAYMSPEQALMTSLDIDTRSDIYSLGVLLYELLTGRTPLDTPELLKSGLDEMRRTIREKEPARPSNRLNTLPQDDLTTAAKRRSTNPPQLIHDVRGDLDWIVMTCLEKDRTRRYETANGLASDIQRHLNTESIVARPPSAMYRFQKAVRRNKVAFTAAGAIAFSLILGLGLAIWQAVRAHAAEREQTRLRLQAEASERAAKTEALRNERVSRFFRDMLKGVGPSVSLGRDTTLMREILDKTAQSLGADLKEEPSVEAQLRNTVGDVYLQLGDLARAEAMGREALALRPRLNGGEHKEVARSLLLLGNIHLKRKDYAQAEAAHREALALRRRLSGDSSEAVSVSLNYLGVILERRGDLAGAEARYREAMEIERRLYGEAGSNPLFNLAGIHIKRREYAEAEKLLQRYLEIIRKEKGDDDPAAANLLEQLAFAFSGQGRLDEAERINRQALAIYEKVARENSPELARALQNVSTVLQKRGKFAESETFLRKSLAIQERLYGHDSREVATTLSNLGVLASDAGDEVQAESYLRDCLAVRTKVFGPDHPDVASALSNLGWTLASQNLLPEAERTLEAALDTLDRTPSARPKDRRLPLGNLFSVLFRQKKFTELELFLDQRLQAATEPGLKALYLEVRGDLHARLSRWPKAAADLARTVELESDNDEHYHELAPLLVQSGDLEAYRKHCQNEVVQFRGTKDPKIAEHMARDCLLLPNSGADMTVVVAWAEIAMTIGQTSGDLPKFQLTKALAEYRQGHFVDAIEWAQKALSRSGDKYRDPQATAVLAMAQHQSGQQDGARASLARAVELEGKLPKLESGDIIDSWLNWIFTRTLLREARDLIEGEPASITAPGLSNTNEATHEDLTLRSKEQILKRITL